MIKRLLNIYIFLLVISVSNIVFAATVINAFKLSVQGSSADFTLNFSNQPDYKIFLLDGPDRLVIDLKNTKWQAPHSNIAQNNGLVKQVRHAKKNNDNLRVVIDLTQSVKIQSHLVSKPGNNRQNYKLVITMSAKHPQTTQIENTNPIPTPALREKLKPLIIIDAGHGGNDPGTMGKRGTKEKNLTLEYAIALKTALLSTNHYKVYMTRNHDHYVALKQRVRSAENKHGDLFISLHADSHRNQNIKGLSIYTLSDKASDKESEELAQKENRPGKIGNILLEDENDDVTNLLIDLVQRDTKNRSASFAELLVQELRHNNKMLFKPHRFAGFRVLTGPDIPSVLIEMGYLSNSQEEKMLNSVTHKKELVSSIVKAIDKYSEKYMVE